MKNENLNKRKVEILAPCQDIDALKGAISSGADAVYFGLDVFNARIRAKNFTLEDAKEAVNLCHAHGVKAYITLNTELYNKELQGMLDYVGQLYEIGVDALIVADFGVAKIIKEHYKDMEIHASTQASAHNLDGVNTLSKTLGFSRVVLARELDYKNIKHISENAIAETEIFVHGAHCMSVSGQCLASFFMGGRSGNRGECAQPCRLPYTIGGVKGYPLSLKDMSLSTLVNEVLSTGAKSLKIEGRMKSSSYVAGVVSAWRKLIDEKRNATKGELSTLASLFSRGGFTDGYFKGKINSSMLGIRSERDKSETKSLEEYSCVVPRVPVKMIGEFFLGKKSKLTLICNNKEVTTFGDIVESAINAPMSREDIVKNLGKLGNTPFSLESIEILMDDGIIIRNSSLNALRRQAVEEYFNSGRKKEDIKVLLPTLLPPKAKIKTALFNKEEQIPRECDYFDVRFVPLDRYNGSPLVNGIQLPPVIFDSQWEEVMDMLKRAKNSGIEYALVSNIGQVERVKELGFRMIADYRFNAFNGPCVSYLTELGFENVILSPELSLPQLRDFKGFSIIAYGHIPVMTTHKCIIEDSIGCDKCKGYIKDRQNVSFFVEGIYGHRNIIYNSVPIYMADKQGDIIGNSWHFIFSMETKEEVQKIIDSYKKGVSTNKSIRRIK